MDVFVLKIPFMSHFVAIIGSISFGVFFGVAKSCLLLGLLFKTAKYGKNA